MARNPSPRKGATRPGATYPPAGWAVVAHDADTWVLRPPWNPPALVIDVQPGHPRAARTILAGPVLADLATAVREGVVP